MFPDLLLNVCRSRVDGDRDSASFRVGLLPDVDGSSGETKSLVAGCSLLAFVLLACLHDEIKRSNQLGKPSSLDRASEATQNSERRTIYGEQRFSDSALENLLRQISLGGVRNHG